MDASINASAHAHAIKVNAGHHNAIVRLQEENARLRALLAVCPRCEGDGEITWNPAYPDPRGEQTATCPRCHGTGERVEAA
jgi:DnaJ-class molecular chaperone